MTKTLMDGAEGGCLLPGGGAAAMGASGNYWITQGSFSINRAHVYSLPFSAL